MEPVASGLNQAQEGSQQRLEAQCRTRAVTWPHQAHDEAMDACSSQGGEQSGAKGPADIERMPPQRHRANSEPSRPRASTFVSKLSIVDEESTDARETAAKALTWEERVRPRKLGAPTGEQRREMMRRQQGTKKQLAELNKALYKDRQCRSRTAASSCQASGRPTCAEPLQDVADSITQALGCWRPVDGAEQGGAVDHGAAVPQGP